MRKTLPETNHRRVISRETEKRRWAFVLDEAKLDLHQGESSSGGMIIAGVASTLFLLITLAAVFGH